MDVIFLSGGVLNGEEEGKWEIGVQGTLSVGSEGMYSSQLGCVDFVVFVGLVIGERWYQKLAQHQELEVALIYLGQGAHVH